MLALTPLRCMPIATNLATPWFAWRFAESGSFSFRFRRGRIGSVAPFAGARIETRRRPSLNGRGRSPPSRGRGLKQNAEGSQHRPGRVAPFAGARIETGAGFATHRSRGVAPFAGARIERTAATTPTSSPPVAPFAGARIETRAAGGGGAGAEVAPFAGARIETWTRSARPRPCASPPSRGRGLKHRSALASSDRSSRPLRGGAD